MLAVSKGRLLALSTPFGCRGWWHAAWINEDGWEKHMITADQCPRITKEFLESEKRSMPRAVYSSEYMCEFTASLDSVFGYDEVMGALSGNVAPLEI
jgi:hypothetical protein